MRKLLLTAMLYMIASNVFAQPQIAGSGANNTVVNNHTFNSKSFRPPVFRDTTAANLIVSLDSCGKLIFTYDVNAMWYRQCNPKKWVLLSNGNAPVYTADRGVKIITGNIIRLTDTVEGAGTKLQWVYDKSAFRAGYAGTEWDIANIGNASFAGGLSTLASGSYSTAFGLGNTASGEGSTAFGSSSVASGITSFVAGEGVVASNSYSTAFGFATSATGLSSFAIGEHSIASGSLSTATGNLTLAVGNNSFSSGVGTYMNTLNGSVFGAYNDTANYYLNNPSTQVATNPIFTIGNGSGVGFRSNAFQILRNGGTRFSSGITTTTDTTTFKPVVMDVNGNLRKVGNWVIGGLGLKAGKSTMVLGTITVNTTQVGASSIILLTAQETGNLVGNLRVSARVAGTSFTITSTDLTDTAEVGWLIIN